MSKRDSKTAGPTPGPWVWRGKDGGLYRKGKPPHAYGDPVLVPEYEYETGLDTIVSKADAALIAAAPDLLAAANKALNECCDLIGTDAGTTLVLAIAKAHGDHE